MIYFLFIVLMLLSAFLVMIVLLQRGRGGGLAGAFGSGGGTTSAFGTKTGDVFTWVTVIAFVLFMVLSIFLFWQIKWASRPDKEPARISDDISKPDAREITDTKAKLIWRDDASNALGYRISQAAKSEKNNDIWTWDEKPVQEVPLSQTETVNGQIQHYAVLSGLTPGTDYYYIIKTYNKSDETYSNPNKGGYYFHFKTTGDKLQTASMAQEGKMLPKGLFTKELEVALLDHQADLAVHSLKDLPTELPPGLKIGAVLERADVRDVGRQLHDDRQRRVVLGVFDGLNRE